jgi:hypothetical protein
MGSSLCRVCYDMWYTFAMVRLTQLGSPLVPRFCKAAIISVAGIRCNFKHVGLVSAHAQLKSGCASPALEGHVFV